MRFSWGCLHFSVLTERCNLSSVLFLSFRCWPEPKWALTRTSGFLTLPLQRLPIMHHLSNQYLISEPAHMARIFSFSSPFSSSRQLLRFTACLAWDFFPLIQNNYTQTSKTGKRQFSHEYKAFFIKLIQSDLLLQ